MTPAPGGEWLPYEEVHGPDSTVSGAVLVWTELPSDRLRRSREILFYLPPSVADSGKRRAR